MLHEHGIVAFSPEIGDENEWSQNFYVKKWQIPIIVKNFLPSVEYFIQMHKTRLNLISLDLNLKYQKLEIALNNLGISNLYDITIQLKSRALFQDNVKIKKAKIQSLREDRKNKNRKQVSSEFVVNNVKKNMTILNYNIFRRDYLELDIYLEGLDKDHTKID